MRKRHLPQSVRSHRTVANQSPIHARNVVWWVLVCKHVAFAWGACNACDRRLGGPIGVCGAWGLLLPSQSSRCRAAASAVEVAPRSWSMPGPIAGKADRRFGARVQKRCGDHAPRRRSAPVCRAFVVPRPAPFPGVGLGGESVSSVGKAERAQKIFDPHPAAVLSELGKRGGVPLAAL